MSQESQEAPERTRTSRTTTPPAMDTKQRLAEVLHELIDTNARRTERLLVIGRLILLTLSMADLLVAGLRYDLSRLPYVLVSHLIVGAVMSGLWIATYRQRRTILLLRASVLIDAVAMFALFIPAVRWTEPGYTGFLHMFEAGLIPLAIVAAGFRLRRHLTVLGLVSGFAVAAGLTALDYLWNAEVVTYTWTDLMGWIVLLFAAAMLSFIAAMRTRMMVFEAAQIATRAERARERLRVYVSDEVAREALDGSDDFLSLDGEQRHVAVLFCDLRDFTSYSASMEPKFLVAELNTYFEAMVPIIQEHGGTVDKFMGDAIMAVFPASPSAADVSARALAAAGALRRALDVHNGDRAAAGRPSLRHGIGLHSGWVVAGNVGTQDRVQFTVIGDVVNVASRLEKATKQLNVSILCSAVVIADARRTGSRADVPAMVSLGKLELRGIDGSLEVYAPADEVTA